MADRIVIAGAGSIGCYVGGALALAGKPVTFLGRPRITDALTRDGLRVSDLEGRHRTLDPAGIVATDDPAAALAGADIVLVCVKSGATAGVAAEIDRHAPPDALVISLQNGVENAARLRAAIRQPQRVVAGMVPFNVVLEDDDAVSVHRATDGDILVEDRIAGLDGRLSVEGLQVGTQADMRGVLWSKLLMNLNNALVALSDLPLADELADRRWRRILARQIDEALAVINAADIRLAKLSGVSPSFLPTILRLPDWLFRRVARRMLAVDPKARSSMWEDLVRRRPTEIEEFQGAIIRLSAASSALPTPISERVRSAVRAAEAAGAGPPALKASDLFPNGV